MLPYISLVVSLLMGAVVFASAGFSLTVVLSALVGVVIAGLIITAMELTS